MARLATKLRTADCEGKQYCSEQYVYTKVKVRKKKKSEKARKRYREVLQARTVSR